jgi:hypothetical protein
LQTIGGLVSFAAALGNFKSLPSADTWLSSQVWMFRWLYCPVERRHGNGD